MLPNKVELPYDVVSFYANDDPGLAKAQYTVGFFTESGIGCRRDPLEANVWYVKAADQGEDRAKHRLAAIQAASEGANPMSVAKSKKKSERRSSDGKSEFYF